MQIKQVILIRWIDFYKAFTFSVVKSLRIYTIRDDYLY